MSVCLSVSWTDRLSLSLSIYIFLSHTNSLSHTLYFSLSLYLSLSLSLQASTDGEVLVKFALQFKKLEDAVTAVVDFLGKDMSFSQFFYLLHLLIFLFFLCLSLFLSFTHSSSPSFSFSLSLSSFLGMLPADGTGVLAPSDAAKRTHTLHLIGTYFSPVVYIQPYIREYYIPPS